MFNVGPLEMLVLAAVALIVFGPDKLPQLARDAARMLRTLRTLAQGARSQLNDELGPEFADFDLRTLNPRTAIRNALLGDEDLASLNPREAISRALRGEDDPAPGTPPSPAPAATTPPSPAPAGATPPSPAPAASQPAARSPELSASELSAPELSAPEPAIRQTRSPLAPGDFTPYDPDAT